MSKSGSGVPRERRKVTWAERVANLREALDLSQRELAEVLGVDEASVRYWEGGRRQPSRLARRALTALLQAADRARLAP